MHIASATPPPPLTNREKVELILAGLSLRVSEYLTVRGMLDKTLEETAAETGMSIYQVRKFRQVAGYVRRYKK